MNGDGNGNGNGNGDHDHNGGSWWRRRPIYYPVYYPQRPATTVVYQPTAPATVAPDPGQMSMIWLVIIIGIIAALLVFAFRD